MELKNHKIIGIVGGMGPQAGVALMNSIVRRTRVATDQEHLSTVLMSFPGRIADRTLFLEGCDCPNPAYNIASIIHKLESAGATVVGMACNTSHAPRIYDVIIAELKKANSQVNLLHMPYETCRYIQENHRHARRIGIMTTNGTYRSGVYKNLLQNKGYEVIIPDPIFQDEVIHKMVYDPQFGIKSNTDIVTQEVLSLMEKALHFFTAKGADLVILGCTELSLVPLGDKMTAMVIADSSEILAGALIREATNTEEYNRRFVCKANSIDLL
jgi:aspartate racemase